MKKKLLPWVIRLAKIGIVFMPLGVAFVILTVQVTSLPKFCGSCHFMKPYYESWKTSSHKDTACVECHIPPGVVSEIEKKYEATAMVVSYFTGTYGTNPWAEVPDRSCLRTGCHEKRLLVGKEVYKGVLFDHRPHLTELRRGKRLRCTSCHSQIVQGSHISVTSSTCVLCHFKGVELNHGTGRCTLCHEIPEKTITAGGISFDHGDVKHFGMDCMFCHQGIVKGNGPVPSERCYTCHNEPARLKRYGETERLHEVHVSEHKVECLNCHIEIMHKMPARIEATATGCQTCHTLGHSPTRDLYVGLGGKGVTPRASPMFLAGVRCEGCHFLPAEGLKKANEVSCMACHGAKYFRLYRWWKEGVERRLQMILDEEAQLDRLLGEERERFREAMEEVQQNTTLVKKGQGIHNPHYALALLGKAHESIVDIVKGAGFEESFDTRWIPLPKAPSCMACHLGEEFIETKIQGRRFPHLPHVSSQQIACTRCHGTTEDHGSTKGLDEACRGCHPDAEQMKEASLEDCLGCHEVGLEKPRRPSVFPHGPHIEAELECAECHEGVQESDHLSFIGSDGAVLKPDHPFCGNCHEEELEAGSGSCEGMCHSQIPEGG